MDKQYTTYAYAIISESKNIVISQDYENFPESSKLQVAQLMLAPNFIVTSVNGTTYN
ncbi:hypothetical protein B0H69_002324 [Clostridium beijerinckii]|jgi:hypothetical protein|uniref:hypothetical protein n=1 Tax=Clostridium beijerinckii TaxID=1520 RepID=UPI00156E2224|nr:hypothetical protein [Clostridium beijerinckii]NRZ34377.1 hypothetical protein [Clostridium beijerinckii]NSA13585.1 hypothetical protein [Clostridium beijerinckii]NSA63398.1 hypothetical protein [Clostridium beijerinckii]NYC08114.1 hypothetical protein [Clostridium beijerinckii]NYC48120.1 hypothetical protein [Clostridium beijerinckii]